MRPRHSVHTPRRGAVAKCFRIRPSGRARTCNTARVRDSWGPGDTIGGRYWLIDRLGVGGMGSAWRAWDIADAVYVCLKLAALGDDVGLRQRWIAESAMSIDGPHLLQVKDWNSGQHGDYIAMPLMAGGSVAELVARHGSLPAGQVVEVLMQTGQALHYMHRQDAFHRDVKPSNLLLEPTSKGRPLSLRVADFGIIASGVRANVTSTRHGPPGTPGFIAPEAYRAAPDGSRAAPNAQLDLFALGVSAYFAATSHYGSARSCTEAPQGWVRYDYPEELEFPDTISQQLQAVIRQLMSPDPRNRQASAAVLLRQCQDLPRMDFGKDFSVPDALFAWPKGWGPQGPSSSVQVEPATRLVAERTDPMTVPPTRAAIPRLEAERPPGRESPRSEPRRGARSSASKAAAVLVVVGAGLALGGWALSATRSGDDRPSTGSSISTSPGKAANPPAKAGSDATAGQVKEPVAKPATKVIPPKLGAIQTSIGEGRFTHFDVDVLSVASVDSRVEVTVRVCIKSLTPDSVGGKTRVSWEPWLLSLKDTTPVTPDKTLADRPGMLPQSRYYSPGTCGQGKVPFTLSAGSDQIRAILYRNGQGDTADFPVEY